MPQWRGLLWEASIAMRLVILSKFASRTLDSKELSQGTLWSRKRTSQLDWA